MKLNLPEWPLLLVGSIFAAMAGGFPVAFAIIMSEILEVFIILFFIHYAPSGIQKERILHDN